MGVRKQVSPVILAAITIFTMLFDILSPAGVYAIMMSIDPTIQIDVIFVIAILTTMGYSINDTVIIFDRIRENLEKAGGKAVDYAKIFEDSLRQTMKRSMGTSISTLLVVIAMYVFGAGDLARFAFTMMIGIISGTFSSIFLAAPLAYLIIKYQHKNVK
jgi:preprotein translocase SecF subunit